MKVIIVSLFTNLNVQVLDGLFGLDEVQVEGESGDLVGPVRHEEDGELELGDVLALLFVEDLEGLDQLVRHALHHAHLRLRLVLARAQRERHRTVLLAHLKEFQRVGWSWVGTFKLSGKRQSTHRAEELARVFHLEHVGLVRLLEDGDLDVLLLALSLAGGDENVDREDLVQLKVKLVMLLPLRLRWVLNIEI